MEYVPGGELFTRLLEEGVLPVKHVQVKHLLTQFLYGIMGPKPNLIFFLILGLSKCKIGGFKNC